MNDQQVGISEKEALNQLTAITSSALIVQT